MKNLLIAIFASLSVGALFAAIMFFMLGSSLDTASDDSQFSDSDPHMKISSDALSDVQQFEEPDTTAYDASDVTSNAITHIFYIPDVDKIKGSGTPAFEPTMYDYNTYVAIWDQYASDEQLPYDDPDKMYAVMFGYSENGDKSVYLNVSSATVTNNMLDAIFEYDEQDAEDNVCGTFVIIPVDNNVNLGNIQVNKI